MSQGDDWDQWLVKSIAAARNEDLEVSRSRAPTACSSPSSISGETAECVPLARQMIDRRARARHAHGRDAQFRKNLLLARFHVEDALEETVEVGRASAGATAEPAPARPRRVALRRSLCADLGLDEEIDRDPRQRLRVLAIDLTRAAMILWAKAEADWLAGRAAEALQTAEECRPCPSRASPRTSWSSPCASGPRSTWVSTRANR